MLRERKLSLYRVKKIIRHFCADIDATKTAIVLGVNRNTVNRYYGIFRQAIYQWRLREFEALEGAIEMDESYFGRSRVRGYRGKLKRGRGTQKQPVFGIFKRQGKVYTEIIPDCKRKPFRRLSWVK
jgi:transposase